MRWVKEQIKIGTQVEYRPTDPVWQYASEKMGTTRKNRRLLLRVDKDAVQTQRTARRIDITCDQGNDNTILRVQLKSQELEYPEDLLSAMKSYAENLHQLMYKNREKSRRQKEKGDNPPRNPIQMFVLQLYFVRALGVIVYEI